MTLIPSDMLEHMKETPLIAQLKSQTYTSDDGSTDTISDEHFIAHLPNSYRFKAKKMICHINAHPVIFEWSNKCELVHEKIVCVSAFLLRFFIKKNLSLDKAPPGINEFASLLLDSKISITSTGDNFKHMFPYYQKSEADKHMWWR